MRKALRYLVAVTLIKWGFAIMPAGKSKSAFTKLIVPPILEELNELEDELDASIKGNKN